MAADLGGAPDGRTWTSAFNARDGYATTSRVGQIQANGFGLYDMHENADEWCADRYDAYYYAGSPSADPSGPATGSHRVGRGGGYSDCPAMCGWPVGSPFRAGLSLLVTRLPRRPSCSGASQVTSERRWQSRRHEPCGRTADRSESCLSCSN